MKVPLKIGSSRIKSAEGSESDAKSKLRSNGSNGLISLPMNPRSKRIKKAKRVIIFPRVKKVQIRKFQKRGRGRPKSIEIAAPAAR